MLSQGSVVFPPSPEPTVGTAPRQRPFTAGRAAAPAFSPSKPLARQLPLTKQKKKHASKTCIDELINRDKELRGSAYLSCSCPSMSLEGEMAEKKALVVIQPSSLACHREAWQHWLLDVGDSGTRYPILQQEFFFLAKYTSYWHLLDVRYVVMLYLGKGMKLFVKPPYHSVSGRTTGCCLWRLLLPDLSTSRIVPGPSAKETLDSTRAFKYQYHPTYLSRNLPDVGPTNKLYVEKSSLKVHKEMYNFHHSSVTPQ